MEPWMVILSVLLISLALWYVPLAVYEHRRRRRPARRWSGHSMPNTSNDVQAAITVTTMCSSIDPCHHG